MRIIRSLEEMRSLAGQDLGASRWVEVTQERIDRFAEATGDHQWIHVDVARAARELSGGRTIAHGWLTLSLAPVFINDIFRLEGVSRRLNYGANRIRFIAPVPAGTRLRGRYRLLAAEQASDGALKLTGQLVVEVEGGERPACVAELISIVYP